MSVPSKQKALQLEKGSGESKTNQVVLREVPVPQPGEGMVLLKLLAAGFNRRDQWAVEGAYPGLVYKDSTCGCDGAALLVDPAAYDALPDYARGHPQKLVLLNPTRGWDDAVEAPEVENDPVLKKRKNKLGGTGFGILGNTHPTGGVGTFCEYVAIEKEQLVAAPKHLDAVHAAALPCGGVTAFRALFTKGQLRSGQNLLITGIGGGVAQLAAQFAVAAGANVYVTGGTKEKVSRAVEKLGAKGGAVYKDKDWAKQIAALLPKDRPYLDVVLDSAGGDVSAQSIKAGLKTGGKVVCFGMTAKPQIPVTMREVLKNVDVLGSTMGSRREFIECCRFVEKHGIVPVLDTVLDGLDNATKGYPLLADADKRSGGKVIIKIRPEREQRGSKL